MFVNIDRPENDHKNKVLARADAIIFLIKIVFLQIDLTKT